MLISYQNVQSPKHSHRINKQSHETNITSTPQTNFKKLRQTFTKNNYPETFINNLFKKCIQNHYNENTNQKQNDASRYITFPCIEDTCHKIQNNNCPQKPTRTLESNFTNSKCKTKRHALYIESPVTIAITV